MWPTYYIPYQESVEGKPPTRIYYTTPPYSPEITESLTSSSSWVSGSFSIGAADQLEASMSFVSGTLNDILVGFDGRYDELEASLSFVSGSMVSTGFKAGFGKDELEASCSFVSGTLNDILIRYDNWPLAFAEESLEASMSFVSGALT